jgi:hypothetical protein
MNVGYLIFQAVEERQWRIVFGWSQLVLTVFQ